MTAFYSNSDGHITMSVVSGKSVCGVFKCFLDRCGCICGYDFINISLTPLQFQYFSRSFTSCSAENLNRKCNLMRTDNFNQSEFDELFCLEE